MRLHELHLDAVPSPPGGAVFVVDAELRFVHAEGDALERLGIAPDQLIGRKLVEALDPTRLGKVVDLYRDAVAGRRVEVAHDFGGRRFLSRGQPLHDGAGAVRGALVVSYDVSGAEREATVARLTGQLVGALVDGAPFGVFVVDAALRIRLANEGALPLFEGVSPLVGASWVDAVHRMWDEPVSTEVLAQFHRTLDTGQPAEPPVLTALRRDRGRVESYSWQLRQVTLPDGEVGVACYVHDLTATHLAQQVLADAARRDAFRVAFADQVRPLTRPAEIIATASALVGRHLGISRVAYGTVSGGRANVVADWTDGTTPNARGDKPLNGLLPDLEAGRTVVVEDIDHDDRTTARPLRAAIDQAVVRAFVHVPLVKAGRLVAVLGVSHRSPRRWSAADVQLVEEVADRTWAAIEQAHAEHELRQRTAQLELLMGRAPLGVYLVDQDLRVVRVNQAARPAFGGMAQIEGRPLHDVLSDLWDPDQAEAVLARFRDTLETGVSFESDEYPVDRQQVAPSPSEVYHWRIDRIPLPDDQLGVVCYFRDISREVQTRRVIAARAAFDHFRASFADLVRTRPHAVEAEGATMLREHLGVGRVLFADVDMDTDTVDVRTESRRDDLPPLLGHHPLAVFGPWGAALRSGLPFATDDVSRRADFGEVHRRWYAHTGAAAFAGVPQVVGGAVRAVLVAHAPTPRRWTADDLALLEHTAERTWAARERTRAEAALRASEARLQLALDAARMGTFSWALGQDGGEVDDRFRALLGLAPGEPVDLVEGVARSVHPDDRDAYAAALTRATRPGDGVLRLEVRLVLPDGAVRWALFTGRTLFEGDPPRPTWLVGIAADVTQLKEVEQALREREERLAESDRRKDEFLAILAHELRNPLAPIRTGLQVLRHDGLAPGALDRVRAMMERQVGHMVRLIDDLLDLSRITSGKIRLQREICELRPLVDAVLEAIRPQLASLELDVSLPDAPVWLDVDPARFVQVLSNIVHNATKFTDPGGRIDVVAEVHGGGLVLQVHDTGVGIAEPMIERVFELFAQDADVGPRGQGGLGLGLALARQLLALHGGEISARSGGRGRGSTFTVRLPVAEPQEASAPAAAGAPPGPSRRVVIIDDNQDAADATALLVAAMGGEARVAYDGLGGVALVEAFEPDLVLLDLGMPGMDGFETCRRLRALGRAELRVVALTGWGQDADRQATAEAGFDEHLTKPADPQRLEGLIAGAE